MTVSLAAARGQHHAGRAHGRDAPDWQSHTRLRAELDGLYGHLYGLTRDELSYILDTFPIV